MPKQPDDIRSPGQSRHPAARPRLPFLTPMTSDQSQEKNQRNLSFYECEASHKRQDRCMLSFRIQEIEEPANLLIMRAITFMFAINSCR
jgi:hypothetical protein